jgi:hypothetical protein
MNFTHEEKQVMLMALRYFDSHLQNLVKDRKSLAEEGIEGPQESFQALEKEIALCKSIFVKINKLS